MPLYFFSGQEDFLIEQEINSLKEKLLDDTFSALNFKHLYNPKFSLLEEAILTPPMMFGNMVIQINIENYLVAKKSKDDEDKNSSDEGEFSLNDSQLKRFEDILKDIPESLTIIFTFITSREKPKNPDTRKKMYKIIEKYAQIKNFPQFRDYDEALKKYIMQMAKSKDLTIFSDVVDYFIQYVGVNLRKLDKELDKIKLSVHPAKTVTKEIISDICVSSENIFDIVDYYLKNQKDKAVLELRKVNEKQHYLITLASLTTLISKNLNLKIMSESMSAKDIAIITHEKEYPVKLKLEKIKHISVEELKELKKRLAEIEFNIKSGVYADGESAIEQVFLM